MYQPQLKHKANHGGYRKKPTKGQVRGLMNMYLGISNITIQKPVKKVIGVQLKLEL